MTEILICVVLGSYGSDSDKYHLVECDQLQIFSQLPDSYCYIFVKKIVSYCLLNFGHVLQSEICITFVVIRCFYVTEVLRVKVKVLWNVMLYCWVCSSQHSKSDPKGTNSHMRYWELHTQQHSIISHKT